MESFIVRQGLFANELFIDLLVFELQSLVGLQGGGWHKALQNVARNK